MRDLAQVVVPIILWLHDRERYNVRAAGRYLFRAPILRIPTLAGGFMSRIFLMSLLCAMALGCSTNTVPRSHSANSHAGRRLHVTYLPDVAALRNGARLLDEYGSRYVAAFPNASG